MLAPIYLHLSGAPSFGHKGDPPIAHVQKIIQRFQHAVPARQQDSPYRAPPRKYGAAAQDPLPEDTSDKINEKRVKIHYNQNVCHILVI